jgi:hypothetical protein
MGRSIAGTPGMPSAAPMTGAGPGKRRSLDPLAAKMKPILPASMPRGEKPEFGYRLLRRGEPAFGNAGRLQ